MSSKPNLDTTAPFEHPLYKTLEKLPGLSLGTASIDDLLAWGLTNSLWVFPMATSCCGIELMASAASRVDLDRMGTIVRATPRQADVMVVAGTITVKMAPRVLKLWEQMPEPKWCIAMGSCAISGDFYRNLYSVIPGIDTVIPVDVYVPGCPPNPEALMHGLLRLQEKVHAARRGVKVVRDPNPELMAITKPSIPRLCDAERTEELTRAQADDAMRVTEEQTSEPLEVAYAPSTPLPPVFAPDFAGLLRELGVDASSTEGPPIVPLARHYELARRLKDLGYRQYVSVVASHWPAGLGRKGKDDTEPEHYEIAYILRTVGRGSRVATWVVRAAIGEPVPTLFPLFAGADWQEREQYDLVGVRFAGHPDLRRLMMAENYVGHPLRRDFPSDAPAAPWR
ncbi:MAG: NADH-quinone oxidoreductase subunit NuoB [Planctomycetes bacterium]|nr:NADH-quinone oxidoreductase subunit NuoB [Planctomycetota bacterium]